MRARPTDINLRELKTSQFSLLTGLPYQKILGMLRRLEPVRVENRTRYYDPREALPLIYVADPTIDSQRLMALEVEITLMPHRIASRLFACKTPQELEDLLALHCASVVVSVEDMVPNPGPGGCA